jgi:serine/threonine-protein kinase
MSKSTRNPKGSSAKLPAVIDPEKTLAVPSPGATTSRPDWLAAEDLVDSVEIPVDDMDDLDIHVVEDEFLGKTMGKFQLLELIGEGGMGKVYLAEHTKIGRMAAIKLLRPKYAARKDIVHRFFQEARAVNQIRHDNIVQITDFVESEGKAIHTYLVMELLTGDNLGDVLRRGEPIEPTRALSIFIQICSAVQAAHSVGIVHRDLKPDNIFLVRRTGIAGEEGEFVKVLDYGVAKLMGDAIGEEKKNVVIGTPAYMSPEQASAREVDHRADIYSLGAMMYRVLCGRPVFEGSSIQEYVKKHLQQTPIPPNQVIADIGGRIPPGLEKVILMCLEKNPNDRFQSVNELRLALVGILEHISGDADPTRPDLIEMGKQARKRPLLWVLMFLLVAAGAAASTIFFFNKTKRQDQVAGAQKTPAHPPEKQPPPAKLIEINLVSMPLGAEVFRADDPDEKTLGVTPFKARFPTKGGSINLVFRLDGYKQHTVTLGTSENSGYLAKMVSLRSQGKKRKGSKKQVDKKQVEKQPDTKKKVDKTHTLDPFAR